MRKVSEMPLTVHSNFEISAYVKKPRPRPRPWEEDLHCSLLFAHKHNAFIRFPGLTGIRYTVAGRQQLLHMETSYCIKNDILSNIHFSTRFEDFEGARRKMQILGIERCDTTHCKLDGIRALTTNKQREYCFEYIL